MSRQLLGVLSLLLLTSPVAMAAPDYRSPAHFALSPDGATAYVADHTADAVRVVDLRAGAVTETYAVGRGPVHVVVSPDGGRLYVSARFDKRVHVVDLAHSEVSSFAVGREPYGLLLSRDGSRLYVANSVDDTVSVHDPQTGAESMRWSVGRQPRYMIETEDGRLVVVCGLDRAVWILDTAGGAVLERRHVPKSSLMRQVVATRDGRYVLIAHLLSHDEVPTLQMERGWIHSNGFSVLDLDRSGRAVTLLLDELLRGAANPWGVALSPDGRTLYVTLSGIHEVALVDLPRALALAELTQTPEAITALSEDVEILAREGIARRVPSGGIGPRGVAWSDALGAIVVGNYFSETLTVLDPENGTVRATIALGAAHEETLERRGERLFNDARLCYQNWYTCASCHQEDATVDALNWDLPNDGVGNSKNAKTLHDVADTPPAMWAGVRSDMDAGVQAGQRFLGAIPNEENHEALLAFLRNARIAPNPFRGDDSDAEARGKRLFERARCPACHMAPKYTDLRMHDVGLRGPLDQRSRFDTPSLRDVYRTAPYLHDGRAPTLLSIFTDHNVRDWHGRTRGMTPAELADLVAYVRSL